MFHTSESPNSMLFLVIGRSQSTEFQPVVAFLNSQVAEDSQLLYLESVSVDSARNARRNFQADMIVVLQSHPDEFDENDVEFLIAEYPLAQLVCCYGTWCESFRRTRHAWPLACCLPVRNAICRIEQDILAILGKKKPLPLTASRAESYHHNNAKKTRQKSK